MPPGSPLFAHEGCNAIRLAGFNDGRVEERAAIVAWLRRVDWWGDYHGRLPEAIEAGEHNEGRAAGEAQAVAKIVAWLRADPSDKRFSLETVAQWIDTGAFNEWLEEQKK